MTEQVNPGGATTRNGPDEWWERLTHWLRSLGRGEHAGQNGPGQRMFSGIQRRMTLWYAAVLAAILLLAGIVLYASMQEVLLGPVDTFLAHNAQDLSHDIQVNGLRACGFGHRNVLFVACYDTSGTLVSDTPVADTSPSFIDPSLAQTALASGSATDTINAGGGWGQVRRYAYAQRDVNGQIVWVVQVGYPIADRTDALNALRSLLLQVGVLTLLVATLGGLFLARRALAPARLSFARQQQFIADASHELRTPLTILRADAEVLLRGRARLDPDDATLLEDIVVETEHLSTLATSLLTLARLDAGAQRVERDVVNLQEIAADTLRRVQALAAERQVALTLVPGGPVLVVGDRNLLAQVALILVDNALKYNRPGGNVTVRSYIAGQRAFLDVRDNGEGIRPEHLARLGDRFYRVDKARSREAGGAGLGLSIARGIATTHHGTLTLSSAPNLGTTASLVLPAAGTSLRQ